MNGIEERIRSALAPYRLNEALTPVAAEPPSPSRSRRRRLTVLMAAAAALALVVFVLATLLPVGAGGPDPAVASLLHRFGQIAERAAPEPAPRPGQYVYTETMAQESYLHYDGPYRFVYTVSVTTQQWRGTDGAGRQVNAAGHPSFPTEADRSTYESYLASGATEADLMQADWGKTTQERYGPGGLFWRDTSTLPTDPVELGRLIGDRQIVGGPDGDWESFVLATDLIRDSYARPELRAALYAYMAGLSGIELLGNTTDALGRAGVALASTHDGIRNEVIFDRSNAKILEEREVVLDPDESVLQNPGSGEVAYANPGQTFYASTYATFGEVVDSTTQEPAHL